MGTNPNSESARLNNLQGVGIPKRLHCRRSGFIGCLRGGICSVVPINQPEFQVICILCCLLVCWDFHKGQAAMTKVSRQFLHPFEQVRVAAIVLHNSAFTNILLKSINHALAVSPNADTSMTCHGIFQSHHHCKKFCSVCCLNQPNHWLSCTWDKPLSAGIQGCLDDGLTGHTQDGGLVSDVSMDHWNLRVHGLIGFDHRFGPVNRTDRCHSCSLVPIPIPQHSSIKFERPSRLLETMKQDILRIIYQKSRCPTFFHQSCIEDGHAATITWDRHHT